ncbi:MAG: hypothetical protein LQ342_002741 [Letrouitia transgressa]|nr:MAG: hypothetical protein LQ342_002741 [Letrouitia transgressa]
MPVAVFPVLNPDAPNELDKQLYRLSPPNGALDTVWRHKLEQLNRIPISKPEIREIDNKVAGTATPANREGFPITESAMDQLKCLVSVSPYINPRKAPVQGKDDYCTQMIKRNLLCHSLSSDDERRGTESGDEKVAERRKNFGRSGRERLKQALMEEYRPKQSREEVCGAIGR